jgi:hypothetical protein
MKSLQPPGSSSFAEEGLAEKRDVVSAEGTCFGCNFVYGNVFQPNLKSLR